MAKTYTVNGFTGTLPEIAKHFGMNTNNIYKRLERGMSIEEAVNTPLLEYETYTVNGFTGNITQIAEYFKMNKETLRHRLKIGMTIEEAVDTPLGKINKSNYETHTVNGFIDTLPEIAKHFEINADTLRSRLKNGMSIEEAVKKPVRATYTVDGFTGTIPKIAKHFGINETTIRYRLKIGMSIEEAVSIPNQKIRIKDIEYNGEIGNLRYFCKKYDKDYIEVYNKLKYLHTLEYSLESTSKPYQEE